jgi:hypothetical protein
VSDNQWNIYDPDKLLDRSDDEIATMEFNGFICNEIIPREDLFQATNNDSGKVVDLGYYGCESNSNSNGTWVLNVIGDNLDWENPLEKIECTSLVESVALLKEKLNEYATLNK